MESLLSLSQMGQKTDTEIIAEVVEDSIRLTGSTIGYLATMNEDESVMTMQYWSKSAHESCTVIDKPIVYPIEKTGLWGEAVRQRKPIVTNDYAADSPFKRGTPPGHVRLVRHVNIPVFDGDHIVAIAGVGNKEVNYDEGDIRQLQILMQGWWQIVIRKRVEEALHASRQLFADIISFLPDPTFVIDKDGRVLAWNRAMELLSGVSASDIVGKADFEYSLWMYGKRRPILIDLVLHPDQDAGRLDYTNIHWERRSVTAQAELTRPGTRHTISLSLVVSPLIDAQGTITGAIESMRDISRLKETEAELARINRDLEKIVEERTQALTESERKYRTLFDKTKDAFLIIENNKFIDCNASALQMIGFSTKEELFQIHPSLLSPPTQPDGRSSFEKAEEMMAIAMREGSHRFEWVHRRANGEDFWVEVSLTAIPIQDHQIIHTAWRDITDRKKAEAEIRASLEEKVLLLREIHHRVNNNLQIIISLINLQMRQTHDPEVKRIVSETQNRVRAMSLVHEKLYRSESLSRIDFADYTHFLATQLFSFYGTDTRRVRLDMAMGKIMVDITTAVPLGLLMNELISNALRHAFPNGREGAISIRGGYEGDLIMLVVHDNGIGIPEDFDWKNTTSLGMRLVTSLIDQVDGTIALDRNQGTTFTVTVKREPAPGERDE
jgi:PAS domain S-box-containing protein